MNLEEGATARDRNNQIGRAQGMRGPYDDIIDLPHHVSKRHPQMPADERAAQFSPFAALVDTADQRAVIRETARLTDRKMELSENMKEELERKLKELCARNCEGEITFFVPDGRKEGGAYVTAEGRVKKTDDAERAVCAGGWHADSGRGYRGYTEKSVNLMDLLRYIQACAGYGWRSRRLTME